MDECVEIVYIIYIRSLHSFTASRASLSKVNVTHFPPKGASGFFCSPLTTRNCLQVFFHKTQNKTIKSQLQIDKEQYQVPPSTNLMTVLIVLCNTSPQTSVIRFHITVPIHTAQRQRCLITSAYRRQLYYH